MEKQSAKENPCESKCPYCGGALSFSNDYVGTAQDCPHCLECVVIPNQGCGYAGKLPIPIRTARLTLRSLQPADLKDLLELMADDESLQQIGWRALDAKETGDWIEVEMNDKLTHSDGQLCLGIVICDSSKLIGFASVYYTDEHHRQAGITMMINHDYRRCGFGTETIRALFAFGFAGLNLHRFAVGIDSRNKAACGMLEKAGMRREGEFVQDRYLREWVNTVWYALLQEEFEEFMIPEQPG